jgi:hypothetical protein
LGIQTTDLTVIHETSPSTTSNIVHHWLRVGPEQYRFEEDTKVAIYVVNGNQIPRLTDAMIRALLHFRDQVSSKDLGVRGETILAAIDREVDRQVIARRRGN